MKNRETWLDIAKGIGIISVVIGHSGNSIAQHYLFWFHMPLFFIISGYLFKKIEYPSDFKKWTIKRSFQLLLPYFSFGILLSFLAFFFDFSTINFLKRLILIAYGGEFLTGLFGVFWFITCLYFTQVLFASIVLYVKRTSFQICIILIFYLLSHTVSLIPELRDLKTPWNIDIVFQSIVYYAIGFYGKKYFEKLIKNTFTLLVSTFLVILSIAIELNTISNFKIDMKVNIYSPILLDLLIPIIFTLFIFSVSYKISKVHNKTIFETLGTISITIMYLHIPINLLFINVIGDYNIIVYSVIGVILPLLIHFLILSNFNITRMLFLGIRSQQLRNKISPNTTS